MDKERFTELVKDFVRIYGEDFMESVNVEYYTEEDEPSAGITFNDVYGFTNYISLKPSEYYDDIVINQGGDISDYEANGKGLYCELWHETSKKLVSAYSEIEELKSFIEEQNKPVPKIQEGKVKKGGINERPPCPRPSEPPKGQI